jgi:poly-gamma-glutamate synthesis protein (capsule biosynthesis protein)
MQRNFHIYGFIVFFYFASLAELVNSNEITLEAGMPSEMENIGKTTVNQPPHISSQITLFLSGDVMTGRGIDQVLPHPGDPLLHESYMKNAGGYVKLAEDVNGRIQQPVNFSYIWGDALVELERVAPDIRLINLETSVTKSDDYWKGKGIHYRMHPKNIPGLTAAGIDICSLANNHVLDWGYSGLLETLATLKRATIKSTGAGRTIRQAEAPALMEIKGKGRVIVFSYGLGSSGIPPSWAASKNRPGVNLLQDVSDNTVRGIKENVQHVKQKGDIVVASIHWGGNWGYEVPRKHTVFAHKLIDRAGVDIIHGHSSHHAKGIEVYKDKLILYGCGDFLNDYEGIGGYEEFRAELALMYFASVDPSTGKLLRLLMTPTRTQRLRVNRASSAEARWLRDILTREGAKFGNRVQMNDDGRLTLQWD